MTLTRRSLLASAAAGTAAGVLPLARARAQSPTLKIGVLTDLSGPYKDIGGTLSVDCVRLAFDDFGAKAKGLNVEVISADHQNKPDVGAGIARQWFDRDGVDVIVDVPNSAVSLAVSGVAKDKDRIFIASNPATSDLTGKACNANTIHWTYDTWMLAHSTGGALVRAGGDTWYFITADYAFGHALQRDTTNFIDKAGGKVLGSSTYPFPGTSDFSSYLLQAQSSGAKVIGFANAGADTINSIKQSKEFGITQKLAGLLVFIADVHGMGLQVASGLNVSSTFYWDLNDRTRAFSDRLWKIRPDVRAGMGHVGNYAGVLHYLKAVEAMGGAAAAKKSGAATVAKMKSIPTDDDAFGKGSVRIDGRALHPCYLFEVKTPAESKGAWDYYKLIATTSADEAFRPLAQGGCPLVKS
jgi:branched-chain amino acid transport system substrate-binding protein